MDNWIIFFGEDWGRHPSTGQHLARELAREHKILWVNSLGLRAPEFTLGDIKRAFTKVYQFATSLSQSDSAGDDSLLSHVYVVSPFAIPLLKYRYIRRLNQSMVRRYLSKIMATLNIENPLVITSAVESVDVIDDLDAAVRVYYCADEYSEIAGLDSELVTSLERELLDKIDVVVTTSTNLLHNKSQLHHNVHFLPHGVDYEMFRQALDTAVVPEDIRALHKPMIGFVGLLGEHINYCLIKRLANEIPEAVIVLIGPVEGNVVVPDNESITRLGPKPYIELPAYLGQFDVCIIPYEYTNRNKFANPTKLREYLAAGCPVVSTLQAEVGKLDDYVVCAATEEEFIAEVRRLLQHETERPKAELSIAMREHSWKARADALLTMIARGSGDRVTGRPVDI